MADEMEEVTERFTSDFDEYTANMEEAADTTAEFAAVVEEAQEAVGGLRDHAAEAGESLDLVRDSGAEAAEAQDLLRDSAIEAAEALGHLRDEALEATEAMHELRDGEVEAGGAGEAAGAGGLSMMAVAIVALIGLLAAVAPAVVAAAGAFGAFALFAYEPVMQVVGAIGDTKAQLDKLPGPIQTVVSEVKNLEGEWKRLSAQFTLPVAQLMSQGLGIVSDLLPKLIPLAQAGAKAAGQLMDALGRGLDSKGFSDLLTMMEQLSGPATSALIGLAGALGGVLLNALEQLAPYSVPMIKMLQDLVIAAGPALIGALKFVAQMLMDLGKALTPLLGPLGKFFGYLDDHPVFAQIALGILAVVGAVKVFQGVMSAVSALSNPWVLLAVAIAIVAILIATHTHQISEAFDDVRHHVAEAGHDIAHTFDQIRHDVAQWVGDVRHEVAHIGDDIIRPFQLAASWISGHWKEIAAWLVSPVGMAVHEISTHTHQIAQEFDTMRHGVASTLAGWRHDIATDFDDAMTDVAHFTSWLPHEVAQKFDEARHDAATALDGARHDMATAWDNIRHDAATRIDELLSDVKHLALEIPRELLALPGQMLGIGRNVIMGLIHGIESAASAIPGIMRGLASDVASYFTDPLKLFSPSRLFFDHGWNIVQGAINGVKANAPQLLAAMRGLGGQIATGGLAGAGGSAAAPSVHLTMPVTMQGSAQLYNTPQFLQYLQREVQEAVARFSLNNPGTGFGLPGRA